MKKYYYIYVDHIERLTFYKRFKYQDSIRYFTARYSIYLLAKKSGLNIEILHSKTDNKNSIEQYDANTLPKCRDYLSGYLTKKDSYDLYSTIKKYLESKINSVKALIIWNGTDTADRAITDFAIENDLRTIYLEISNLPGYIFIDPKGTNAESSLYSSLKLKDLESLENNLAIDYSEYIERYKNEKSGSYIPPQAKKATHPNFLFIVDIVYSKIISKVKFQSLSILSKFINIRSRKKKLQLDFVKIDIKENYAFLALQVTNDSQILLNSDIDNEMAIRKAKALCQEEGVQLVVKIHPAECDSDQILKYFKLKDELDFIVTSENTNYLITNSKFVITINSTVGLEAMLFNKDTIFLGRSLYSKFTSENIELYISRYLYQCEYFGTEKISLEGILEHCEFIRKLSLR